MVASDGVRAMMESALTARDRVGVQDFVLLENYTSEAAFIENLRKRFKENLIYVRENWADRASSVHSPAHAGAFRTFVSSLHPDVHRFGAGVGQPLQRPGDLHQGPHGAIPGSQLLRGLTTHVRTKALVSKRSSAGTAEMI